MPLEDIMCPLQQGTDGMTCVNPKTGGQGLHSLGAGAADEDTFSGYCKPVTKGVRRRQA